MTRYNLLVADKLREISTLLKVQNANPFRTQAYLNAALTLEKLPQDIRLIAKPSGIKGLVELPAIGTGIAHSILEYIALGHMSRLDNLKGASDPVRLFQSIPTIGQELAQRIHNQLHIDTLESLENALNSGRLSHVKGLGNKRQLAIKSWLYQHFGGSAKKWSTKSKIDPKPSIELLLKIDSDYRNRAKKGTLPLIKPKRSNPENKTWLPILHTKHKEWHFTVLYSNSERAHKLGRVFDWVIIYFYDNHHKEKQQTIVTETHGSLKGKRVVRGREDECRRYYEAMNQMANAS